MMFDDTYRHQVNGDPRTDSWRVVLFLDIYRKDLAYGTYFLHRMGERAALASPQVRDGLSRAAAGGALMSGCMC